MAKSNTDVNLRMKIVDLRENKGLTYEAIANELGISRQRVHYAYKSIQKIQKNGYKSFEKVCYPKLKEFLMKNGIPLASFCKECDHERSKYLQSILTGRYKNVVKSIRSIMNFTGMSFDELFELEEKEREE